MWRPLTCNIPSRTRCFFSFSFLRISLLLLRQTSVDVGAQPQCPFPFWPLRSTRPYLPITLVRRTQRYYNLYRVTITRKRRILPFAHAPRQGRRRHGVLLSLLTRPRRSPRTRSGAPIVFLILRVRNVSTSDLADFTGAPSIVQTM